MKQYQLTKNAAGFFLITEQTFLCFSGKEVHTFLHNYTTQDIKKLKPGEVTQAAFLDRKGTIVALSLIIRREDHQFLVKVENTKVEALLKHLETFLLLSEIKVEALQNFQHLIVLGPKSGKEIKLKIASPSWVPASAGMKLFAMTWSYHMYGLPGFELLIPKKSLVRADFVDPQILEILRIEAGEPRDGVDITDHMLIQEARLETSAVSFTKGCYLGQEIVARVHTRGHVNRSLKQVKLQKPPPSLPWEIQQNGQKIGTITSCVKSPLAQGYLALGIFYHQALDQIVKFHIELFSHDKPPD
ncbi:MAG: hypothetical protein HYU97_00790 [Deltaproteobacteria bacterium]|nr:hypothetical protein [Deltaproteobacteria bacterium]